ncbi:hypothetical protein IAR55_002887 [Kwoniella newhampshirensis]|uniref:Zinc finger PHD-type domain-containing protein n=1 Tax=Kwoniella newhampshirensis TaxID=1651941 RepID=A0AAW0YQ23_9TREE
MESRRRPSNSATSTSTAHSQRESSNQMKTTLRSPSVGSATPKLEDEDEDTPRRNTRHRNPLPPTSGPLFPPLPPKQPKNSPKNSPISSRSPAGQVRPPTTQLVNSLSGLSERLSLADASIPIASGSGTVDDDAVSARFASPGDRPHLLSASNTSLTPPPPTSEDATMDVDVVDGEEEHAENRRTGPGGEDDWDTYRRHRAVRGFGGAPKFEVKLEPGADNGVIEEDEEEDTPVKTRNGKAVNRTLSFTAASDANTPLSTPGSDNERGRSASRQARRRRGEELLLLDDHLLPAEIRRTGTMGAKKEKFSGAGKDAEAEDDEEEMTAGNAEEAEDEEDTGEGDAIDVDNEGDEEEGKDVTRCVCHQEDIDVMMIQCDECNVWQHGECMGIWGDEEAPDEYFCEECKPERHQPLKKWIRSKGRNPASFIPPSPENLEHFHNDRDKYPPSQSKRWVTPALPPPLLTKSSSRSHHKKEHSPVEAPNDGRRSTRGRQLPASTGRHEKPPSTTKQEAREAKRRSAAPSHNRRISVGGAISVSPNRSSGSPPPGSSLTKKRSTMNSRDSAYEEAVKAALEASRKEMHSAAPEQTADVSEQRGEKRRRGEEEEENEAEKDKAKKGKRKREDEEASGSVEPMGGPGKPKHPNQYTYRPKPPSLVQQPAAVAAMASPARRGVQGGTPVPSSAPTHHEHGTRRAGALANAPVVYRPLTPETANHLGWHLPDHLSAFADLLPGPNPVALDVRAPRVLSYLPRNHFHNQRYGPFSEERDENGKLVLPEEPMGREPVNGPTTQLDPPARVRYPVKRITTAEMKKRVRNVLAYVGRVQIEEGKRQERAKLLGIDISNLPKIKFDEDVTMDHDQEEQPHSNAASAFAPTNLTKSMQLMDELTRDLIAFQESFASNGFASPMPPAVATFSNGNGNNDGFSAPPTPVLIDTSTVPTSVEVEGMVESSLQPMIVEGEALQSVAKDGVVIEDAEKSEKLDVYREGVVDQVVTTGADEREMVGILEGIAETSS